MTKNVYVFIYLVSRFYKHKHKSLQQKLRFEFNLK